MSPPFAPSLIRRLRCIPLTAVLQAVGARQDRDDKARWHAATGTVSVTGAKFFNWNTGAGGGGAIDLAMHLCGFDFKPAVAWLCRCFPGSQHIPAVAGPLKTNLRLPAPAPGHLARVVQYLVAERQIPRHWVAQLVDAGDLYADHRANAIFLARCRRAPVGAELRGTGPHPWRGMAPGSRKDQGYFSVCDNSAHAAILCESAIDAVSCLAIHPRHCCISTAGARPNPAWLPALIGQYPRIYCGFDADSTGDAMAKAMIEAYPAITRLRPALHDWNDLLRA